MNEWLIGSNRPPQKTSIVVCQAGMTMVELMVVISIAAILLVIAAPSFSDLITRTKLNSAASLLASDLNLARSEAVKRNARILVCPANPSGTSCQISTPNWGSGWLVCIDANEDGVCDNSTQLAPNPLVLRQALPAIFLLSALDTAATPSAVTLIRYNPNGRQGVGTLSVNFTLSSPGTNSSSKTINISNTGNVSIH